MIIILIMMLMISQNVPHSCLEFLNQHHILVQLPAQFSWVENIPTCINSTIRHTGCLNTEFDLDDDKDKNVIN